MKPLQCVDSPSISVFYQRPNRSDFIDHTKKYILFSPLSSRAPGSAFLLHIPALVRREREPEPLVDRVPAAHRLDALVDPRGLWSVPVLRH